MCVDMSNVSSSPRFLEFFKAFCFSVFITFCVFRCFFVCFCCFFYGVNSHNFHKTTHISLYFCWQILTHFLMIVYFLCPFSVGLETCFQYWEIQYILIILLYIIFERIQVLICSGFTTG